MIKIIFDATHFNIADTLYCGQVFRFKPYDKGFLVFSKDKCAYCYNEENNAVIECESDDKEYFENYFDLKRDYSCIYQSALCGNYDILKISATLGKGIRILNQDTTETLFSFVISQNNNIPRIKSTIEKLCVALGQKKIFNGEEYYTFPSASKLSEQPLEFFKNVGLGYRAEYILNIAQKITNGYDLKALNDLSTNELKMELTRLKGVGEKVCDCVTLFGFRRSDSFPVDTWIEKVYRENFNGQLKDRKKITRWFVEKFGENSGYYQQYLFYYKRTLEAENRNNAEKNRI